MRNVIKYYYDIDLDELKYRHQEYFFDGYIFKELKRDLDINIYNYFISNHRYIHPIVYNRNGNYITNFENKQYILLEKQRNINVNLQEIINFLVDVSTENVKDWSKLWESKVDYYEKNITNVNNKECLVVFPYYVGLSELAIRFYKETDGKGTCSICHDRLNSSEDFYSPDNIIIDYKVRDIAEYIKISFFNDRLDLTELFSNLDQLFLNSADYHLLYARLLFPTYFYDALEANEDLTVYISKIEQYEQLLNEIYYYLKMRTNIPKIDWLIKKM